jgi:hypothetical protein
MNATGIPEKYQRLFRRAVRGHSPVTAIRVYCLACCDWKPGEVRQCPSATCPLWPYRLRGGRVRKASDGREKPYH